MFLPPVGGQIHGRNDLAPRKMVVDLRRVAGKSEELGERNPPCAACRAQFHDGIERHQGDAHVGGMYCDTGLAAPQDRVTSIETLKCTAARSRLALVAAIKPRIIKIAATRALKDVAAQCRHISQLRRSSGQKRLREQRIALSN